MKVPTDYLYTKNHEWLKKTDDGYLMGITDHAQEQLGEIVYLELPESGDELSAGDTLGVIESTKAVSDIYAPVSGTIAERNEDLLEDDANLKNINESPFDDGWLLKFTDVDENELDDLMDAEAYEALIAEE